MDAFDSMSYCEKYMEDPEPKAIDYEIYESEMRKKDDYITEIENKNENLELELDEAKKIIKILIREIKRYERILM